MSQNKKKKAAKGPYVAGFHVPSREEIECACGTFPWVSTATATSATAGGNTKVKSREEILLGQGGGGRTTLDSIRQLDIQHYYSQDTTSSNKKKFWAELPEPVDETSWLAQVNEPGQTFQEYVDFITLKSGKFKPNSNPRNANIYILPISEVESKWPDTGPDLNGIIEYVAAFFCREVIQLDYVYLAPNIHRQSQKSVIWRTGTHECLIKGRISKTAAAALPSSSSSSSSTPPLPRFQTHIEGLLTEIAAVRDDGKYNNQEISNAFAVVGVTASDIYSSDSDLFVAGMAAGGSKVAVLSLARYHPHIKMCPFNWDDYCYLSNPSSYSYHEDNKKRKLGSSSTPNFSTLSKKSQSEYIRRAGKLIVHEICHVYGLDHCIYYNCIMNGTGHLVEDFSAPSHLCPVCLRKLQFRLGFDVLERYKALLAVFQKWELTSEVKWIQDRIRYLGGASASLPERETATDIGIETEEEEDSQTIPQEDEIIDLSIPHNSQNTRNDNKPQKGTRKGARSTITKTSNRNKRKLKVEEEGGEGEEREGGDAVVDLTQEM